MQWFFVLDSQKIRLSDIIFHQRFLMTYLSLIFVCVGCLAQELKINRKYTAIKLWLDTKLHQIRIQLSKPLDQRFLIVREPLIFICVLHRPKFFSEIFVTYLCMIFVCVKLSQVRTWLSTTLNQCFSMTYSSLVFAYVGCSACAHD